MAEERPEPAHTRDGADGAIGPAASVIQAVATGARNASPEVEATLEALVAARRSLAEGLRDVLALPALGPTTKRGKIAQLQNPEHLLELVRRWHRRTPSMADAVSVCLVATLLQCGRQTVAAFREIADRLDGPVAQKVQLEDAQTTRIVVEHRSVPLPELVMDDEDERSVAS